MSLRGDPNRDGNWGFFDDFFFYNNDTSYNPPGTLNGYTGGSSSNNNNSGYTYIYEDDEDYDDWNNLGNAIFGDRDQELKGPDSTNPNANPLPDPEDCTYVDGNDGYIYVYGPDGTFVTQFENENYVPPQTSVPNYAPGRDENGNLIYIDQNGNIIYPDSQEDPDDEEPQPVEPDLIIDVEEPQYQVSPNPPVQEAPSVDVTVVKDELGNEYYIWPDGTLTDTSGQPIVPNNKPNESPNESPNETPNESPNQRPTDNNSSTIPKPDLSLKDPDNDNDDNDDDDDKPHRRPHRSPHRRPHRSPHRRPNRDDNNNSGYSIINTPDNYKGPTTYNPNTNSFGEQNRGSDRDENSSQSQNKDVINYNQLVGSHAAYWAP